MNENKELEGVATAVYNRDEYWVPRGQTGKKMSISSVWREEAKGNWTQM